MANLTVAVVGDNTIDRYVGARRRDYVGGNAVNVAVQLAGLAVDVRYFGAVGPDPAGARIGAELAARRVDVEGLITLPGTTATTVITVDDSGDRHIGEESFGVTADYFPTDAEVGWMADADWVQIGMLPRASELRGALRALRPGVRIGQDCSVAHGHRDLSVSFESTDVAQARTVAASALARGAALAVVTLGPDGSMAFGPDGLEVVQSAFPVEAIDTTGAGDSFIAGFVATSLHSSDLHAAMAAGAACAARTCTHVGGFPQDPHRTPDE